MTDINNFKEKYGFELDHFTQDKLICLNPDEKKEVLVIYHNWLGRVRLQEKKQKESLERKIIRFKVTRNDPIKAAKVMKKWREVERRKQRAYMYFRNIFGVDTICTYCKKTFTYYKAKKHNIKYCSDPCRKTNKSIKEAELRRKKHEQKKSIEEFTS